MLNGRWFSDARRINNIFPLFKPNLHSRDVQENRKCWWKCCVGKDFFEGHNFLYFHFSFFLRIVRLAYWPFVHLNNVKGLWKPTVFHFRLIMGGQACKVFTSTHALHTYRINLSPFTKDFRVWGAPIENIWICLRTVLGWFTHRLNCKFLEIVTLYQNSDSDIVKVTKWLNDPKIPHLDLIKVISK